MGGDTQELIGDVLELEHKFTDKSAQADAQKCASYGNEIKQLPDGNPPHAID